MSAATTGGPTGGPTGGQVSDRAPVGVVGLGPMGRPMVDVLRAAGWPVVAWNRSPVDPTWREHVDGDPGVTIVETLARVGATAPTVISMITDLPPLVPLVLGGTTADRECAPGDHLLADGHRVQTLVVMSTCSPAAVRRFAADLADRGVDLVDAPVSGGVGGAAAGTLSVMVGAEPTVLERVRPVLETLAGRITHLGPVGSGSVAKACNQLVVNTTVASLAEAVLLAERAGLDVPTVLDALAGGLAASGVLEWKREAFSRNDFSPSGPERLAVKDLGFAAETARGHGASLPVGGAALALFADAVGEGLGELDNAVVLDVLRHRGPET